MTITERLEKEVDRLNLGTVDSKRVFNLLFAYYGQGVIDGQNNQADQEKLIWEWAGGNIRLVENENDR